jgi:succinate dehydrogenase/fumarate reductase cytochrome b subunit
MEIGTMDVLLRVVAIIIEVVILMVIIYSMFTGIWLTIFDLGIGQKYRKVITMALILVGCIVVVFFIAHLTAFYPDIRIE